MLLFIFGGRPSKRFRTKDLKSRRTHWHSKNIFRASGDLLLDPDQQQKRLGIKGNCVHSISTKHLTEKELEGELNQCQEKDTEVNVRTAESYSEQGNTGLTELTVIDEMTQCKACKRYTAEEDIVYLWNNSAGTCSRKNEHDLQQKFKKQRRK